MVFILLLIREDNFDILKQIVTEKGSHLDIRLPSITSALATSRDRTSSAKMLRKHNEFLSNVCPSSPDSGKISQTCLNVS